MHTKKNLATPDQVSYISVGIASPERILQLSSGEVTSPDLVTTRKKSQVLRSDSFESERIFGPTKDYTCACGTFYGSNSALKVCPHCQVPITRSIARHERMGHMVLSEPVMNPLFSLTIQHILGMSKDEFNKLQDFETFIYYNKDTGSFDFATVASLTQEQQVLLDLCTLFDETESVEKLNLPLIRQLLGFDFKFGFDSAAFSSRFENDLSEGILDLDELRTVLNKVSTKVLTPCKSLDFYFGSKAFRVLLSEISHKRYDACVFDRGLNAEFKSSCASCQRCYRKFNDGYMHNLETNLSSLESTYGRNSLWKPMLKILQDFVNGYTDDDGVFHSGIFVMYDNSVESMVNYYYRHIETSLSEEMKSEFSVDLIKKLINILISCKQKSDALQCYKCDLMKKYNSQEDIDSIVSNIRYYHGKVKEKYGQCKSSQVKRYAKQLSVINKFCRTNQEPNWMIFTIFPIPPANTRPSVALGDSKNSKLGIHDTTTILKKILERSLAFSVSHTYQSLKVYCNSYKLLQHAVDCLYNNCSPTFKHPMRTKLSHKKFTSYNKLLSGKKGIMRNNCLGKRVDFSARSVISVDPTLKLDECGLPLEILLELLQPFLIKPLGIIIASKFNINLSSKKLLQIIKAVKNQNNELRSLEKYAASVFDALDIVIQDKYVMLNRAPSLHKLSLQAFKPVLCSGHAIKLNPLVCAGYNADFDGDQMAAHLPLSVEAQVEVSLLLNPRRNLMKPADGKPIVLPSQDMILGAYYLSLHKENEKGDGMIFKDESEVEMAYANHLITFHSNIKLKRVIDGESGLIETTYGLILINRIVPQDLGYIDRTKPENKFLFEIDFILNKGALSSLVARCFEVHGDWETSILLDNLKALGYHYATQAGFTFSYDDILIPEAKSDIISETAAKVEIVSDYYKEGYLTEDEKSNMVIGLWSKATDKVSDEMKNNFKRNPFNPIWMMMDSGARGSTGQLRQIAGMRGLIANASGKTVEVPLTCNYSEGLTCLEYFISGKGARKGFVDTALRTANSGYLTRRLVETAQDIILSEVDCGDTFGTEVKAIYSGRELIETLSERLFGRYLAQPLEVQAEDGTMVTIDTDHFLSAKEAELVANTYDSVKIRSVLSCKCLKGVCTKCYGMNLANHKNSEVGDAIGIIAAQSIGEPGTQLTMRTFHSGGATSEDDITQGLPRIESLFEDRKNSSKSDKSKVINSILSTTDGTVHLTSVTKKKNRKETTYSAVVVTDSEGAEHTYIVSPSKLLVSEGDTVEKGQQLTSGPIYLSDLFALKGLEATCNYFIQEVQTTYRQQGVDVQDKHIEVLLLNMTGYCEILSSSVPHFKVGEEVRAKAVESFNLLAGAPLVTFRRVFKGASASVLHNSNVLTSAGFQQSFAVLRDCAVKLRTDPVNDLMTSVMMGKLIPAGTGLINPDTIEVEAVDDKWDTLTSSKDMNS